ncbi:tyrosine-type recombinase/integrase [Burkholderia ambifaria]|uniref:tyrosine-type recombinase/integrase n=1 Tax=Burkholderia ambifaria TaxID=152480 RepID=UPI001E3FC229|nr:tyrosine-type recombinase/integrase [Burkholderia ambifaria]
MHARRQRWYRVVPHLGAIGAQRITDFVAQHPDTLSYLWPRAVTPRRQLAVGHPALQPVPAHQAQLNTDLQAGHAWIATRGARSEATRRAYRREAERLLLWAIVAKGKPLSSLNTMACAEYLDTSCAIRSRPRAGSGAAASSGSTRPWRSRRAARAPADAAGAAHGGDGAGRHAADRAPRDRRDAAPGRGRAAVQRDFCAGRRPAGAAADLHRASTHWLRHTFANDGLDAGVDIRDMQELLGHASLGTTTLYTKADSAPPVPVGPDLFNAALDGAAGPRGTPTAATTPASIPVSHAVSADPADAAPMVDVQVTLKAEPKRADAAAVGWCLSARCWPAYRARRSATA